MKWKKYIHMTLPDTVLTFKILDGVLLLTENQQQMTLILACDLKFESVKSAWKKSLLINHQ